MTIPLVPAHPTASVPAAPTRAELIARTKALLRDQRSPQWPHPPPHTPLRSSPLTPPEHRQPPACPPRRTPPTPPRTHPPLPAPTLPLALLHRARSPPLPFTLSLSALSLTPHHASPARHLTLPFSAYFAAGADGPPAPYVGAAGVPGRGYRVPPVGQLQVLVRNAERSVVRVFLVRYDIRECRPGWKGMVRQRVRAAGRTEAVVEVGFCATGRNRWWVWRGVRVVWGDGRGRAEGRAEEVETVWGEPRFVRMTREERGVVGMRRRKGEGEEEEEEEKGELGGFERVERRRAEVRDTGTYEKIEVPATGGVPQGLLARKLREVALKEGEE